MQNAANVSAAKPAVAGAISRAPVGTTLPADATTALPEGFKSLGYISDAGLTNSNKMESSIIKAWGGAEVLNVPTGRPDNFKFALIETLNPDVLKTTYGDENVSGDLNTGIVVKAGSVELGDYIWVVDMILKNGVLKRLVIPCASISDIGDIVYADNSVVGYDVTITAVPDASGFTHYEYIQKKAVSTK